MMVDEGGKMVIKYEVTAAPKLEVEQPPETEAPSTETRQRKRRINPRRKLRPHLLRRNQPGKPAALHSRRSLHQPAQAIHRAAMTGTGEILR